MLALIIAAVLAAPPEAVRVTSASAEVVTATLLDDPPGTQPRSFLIVRANGKVGSSGWTGVRLVPREAETGTRYLEFDLVAEKPDGPVLDVMTPVSAAKIGEIRVVPGKLKGVRVRGAGGSMAEAKIKGL